MQANYSFLIVVLVELILCSCGSATPPARPANVAADVVTATQLQQSCASASAADPVFADLATISTAVGIGGCVELLQHAKTITHLHLAKGISRLDILVHFTSLSALQLKLRSEQDLRVLSALPALQIIDVDSRSTFSLASIYDVPALHLLRLNADHVIGLRHRLKAMPQLRAVWQTGTAIYYRGGHPQPASLKSCASGWLFKPWLSCRDASHPPESYRVGEDLHHCGIDVERSEYATCIHASHGWASTPTREVRTANKRQRLSGTRAEILAKAKERCGQDHREFEKTVEREFPATNTKDLRLWPIEVTIAKWHGVDPVLYVSTFSCVRSFSYISALAKQSPACPLVKAVAKSCRHAGFGVESYSVQQTAACGSQSTVTITRKSVDRVTAQMSGEVVGCSQCGPNSEASRLADMGACYQNLLRHDLDLKAKHIVKREYIEHFLRTADLREQQEVDKSLKLIFTTAH